MCPRTTALIAAAAAIPPRASRLKAERSAPSRSMLSVLTAMFEELVAMFELFVRMLELFL